VGEAETKLNGDEPVAEVTEAEDAILTWVVRDAGGVADDAEKLLRTALVGVLAVGVTAGLFKLMVVAAA